MKINRNYKSKTSVYSSDFQRPTPGVEVTDPLEGQYNEDKQELRNLRQKYELHQEADREIGKIEEEQKEAEQRILRTIQELREKTSEGSMIYELNEMEEGIRRLEQRREDAREERNTQKRILMGRIEDKEALCRKYEAEGRKEKWD